MSLTQISDKKGRFEIGSHTFVLMPVKCHFIKITMYCDIKSQGKKQPKKLGEMRQFQNVQFRSLRLSAKVSSRSLRMHYPIAKAFNTRAYSQT